MTTAPANFAVEDHRWFHAIDLGDGVVTLGRFQPGTPPKYTLFGFFDLVRGLSLEGARCVDVGTMDGIGEPLSGCTQAMERGRSPRSARA